VTPHRSRTAWQQAPQTPPGATTTTHDHRLPRRVRLILTGLVVAVVALTGLVVVMGVYVWQAAEYVRGEGEYRDAEAARMEAERLERERRFACDLLDTLPEGGPVDRTRGKYGCGPGIPLSELPSEEAARLEQQRGGASPPPTTSSRPPPVSPRPEGSDPNQGDAKPGENSSPASPPPQSGTRPQGEPGPTPQPAPAQPAPAPPPDDGGLIDDLTDPLTDPVCDALGICL
jgi:hypothetical protein